MYFDVTHLLHPRIYSITTYYLHIIINVPLGANKPWGNLKIIEVQANNFQRKTSRFEGDYK